MSITFTCCELVQALKDWQNNPKSRWTDKDKYFASEIFNKVGFYKFWKDCENCRAWFKEQSEKQGALIEAQIEKEKREGKYYGPRNPSTQKTLEKFKKQADEYQKNLEKDKPVLSFGKSPQE